MKQLLFLLLFPCLALAQYTGNAGQKITLGEQTTADGLVFRGVANDTNVITPFSDTSAYIILDTVNSKFYHYNRTTTYWSLAGGGVSVTSFSAGTTGLTPSTATTGAVTLGGTLAVTNGGTGQSTLAAAGINTGSGTLNYLPKYTATGTTLGNSSIFDNGSGVGIGTASPTSGFQFQVTGTNARFALFNNSSGDSTNFSQMAFGRGVGASEYAEFYRQNNTKRFNIYNEGGDIFFSTNYVSLISDYRYDLFIESDNGNVGINTASPSAKLEILGNTDSYAGMAKIFFTDSNSNSNSRNWSIGNGGSGYGNLTFSVSSVKDGNPSSGSEINAMVIDKSGNVGIGTTSPAVQFHTTSNVRFAGLTSITDLRTDADGDLFNGSDFNLKNSIDTINFGLLDVLKLKPVSFNWNNESRNISEYKSMGFIAQDVMNVIPNAASTMGDGDMQVDYNAIVATLTKAIQEQQALIKTLEQRILILENK
jgi:hypothetical protein